MLVTAAYFFVDDEALELAADGRTFCRPKRESLTDCVGKGKEVELTAQLLVIPLIRTRRIIRHTFFFNQ